MDGLNINFKSLVQNWPNLDGERVTYQHQLVFRVDPSNQSCFCSWIHGLVLGGPIVHLVLGWHKHLFLPNQLEPRIWIEFPGFYIQNIFQVLTPADWKIFWTDSEISGPIPSPGMSVQVWAARTDEPKRTALRNNFDILKPVFVWLFRV